jgi:hypothetical protein
MASKIVELLGSYQDHPAKSVSKHEKQFLIVAREKNWSPFQT